MSDAPLLGVDTSLTGRRWTLTGGDDRLAATISQRLGLHELLGRVLASRQIDLDAVEGFLNPTLRDWYCYFRHAHRHTFSSPKGFIRLRFRAMLCR